MDPTLRARLVDPGFTPSARDLSALFDALGSADRELGQRLERVIARARLPAARHAHARWSSAAPAERARLVAIVGRALGDEPDPELTSALESCLFDADERVRRAAIRALGRLELRAAEPRLLELFERGGPAERRAIAETLAKMGGPAALAVLSSLETADAELARLAARATLMIERAAERETESGIDLDRPLGSPERLVLGCRPGLAPLLAEQAAALGAVQVRGEASVTLRFSGTLRALLRVRSALSVAIEVACPASSDPDSALVDALRREQTRAVLGAWTHGRVRFRLSFSEGGHQRARVLRVARALREAGSPLINDPRGANWQVHVHPGRVLLEPGGYDDPRFAYRSALVRAASHPTVAAALASSAGVRADDVVWDPFVGSGLELVERGLLGPFRALHGSDTDPAALEAARVNLRGAGLHAESLARADALLHAVPGVTLILTNPPMGRRVARDGQIGQLLESFAERSARLLSPGGRLVWLSPFAERTARRAAASGLRVERRATLDMGGFRAELQVFRR